MQSAARAITCPFAGYRIFANRLAAVIGRIALLDEGAHSFGVILGVVGQCLHVGGHVHDLIKGRGHALAHQPLCHAQHMRRLLCHFLGERAGFRHQVVMRHHAADEAPFAGGFRVDHIACEEQFSRAGRADDPRQQPRTAITGHKADLQKGGAKDGLVRRDAGVGKAGHVIAEPDGRSVDGGDHRYFEGPEGFHDAVDAGVVAARDINAGPAKLPAFSFMALMLPPAENALPAPVRMTARILTSALI